MTGHRDREGADEFASPACAMHEADDTYMGYADRDELVAFLNTLLEAERAGARVATESAGEAKAADVRELLRDVARDEARWCGMLLGSIRQLDATPSSRVGAFYEKAMAIAVLAERLAFLNRGQDWVARRLREILPRVRDDRLHADLVAMLDAHAANIARIEAVTTTNPPT